MAVNNGSFILAFILLLLLHPCILSLSISASSSAEPLSSSSFSASSAVNRQRPFLPKFQFQPRVIFIPTIRTLTQTRALTPIWAKGSIAIPPTDAK